MNRRSLGLCLAAVSVLLLGGCHSAADDAAAQKQAIEGRAMTPQEQQEMEKERNAAIQGSHQGAAAQHGKPQ